LKLTIKVEARERERKNELEEAFKATKIKTSPEIIFSSRPGKAEFFSRKIVQEISTRFSMTPEAPKLSETIESIVRHEDFNLSCPHHTESIESPKTLPKGNRKRIFQYGVEEARTTL